MPTPDLDAATARKLRAPCSAGWKRKAACPKPLAGEEAIAAATGAGKCAAVAALARDATLPAGVVSAILASKSAKAVTALAWRTKLSIR